MKLTVQPPFKSLNKAYLKEKVSRTAIETFKKGLTALSNKVQPGHSEDTLKDFITELLRNTWYSPAHAITINKERKDLTIHTGKNTKDPAAVIAEIKKTGSGEMIMTDKPNVKALHELVLYYMQERVTTGNNEIKYLLATDISNWILIDANEFDKKIYRHARIKKLYDVYVNDKKDNPFFYDELKKILDETDDSISGTYFSLDDYKKVISNTDKADDKKLVALYKILSPAHLLKLPFANDSNSLDKGFYAELLHIIGLEEIKEGSKKFIQRKKESSEASLLENVIIKLKDKDCLQDVPDATKFGLTADEQYYNIALELCITWINRILFLKLLEAQLYSYHKGDKEFLFLNDRFIHDYDELSNLFFQVLAEKAESRRKSLQDKYSKVPYLNSSLFERTELERKTIDISSLDNGLTLPLYEKTVLKDAAGKRSQTALSTLKYLFTFLDSYDFTSEGNAEIQEENKTLINASVLGLIFEKINGYKDGSFFTPGFITMYMCRETLRRAIVQKFNDANGWDTKTFEELQEEIEFQGKEKRQQANSIINSITICDPAVGSGHFLVSALNELIAIKYDLKILQYRHNGQRIKEYSIEIVNDELIIQDIETEELFEYTLNLKGNIKPELQNLQETLFHEKEILIENCLFGVDINANSVKICRLRLWIELLKNAYYTETSAYTQLETLPNIDINIKQGNSLISRYKLNDDLKNALRSIKWNIKEYKSFVKEYKTTNDKEMKRSLEKILEEIKKDFITHVGRYSDEQKKLNKLSEEMYKKYYENTMFSHKLTKAQEKDKAELQQKVEKQQRYIDEVRNSVIYKNAFEWRFEFPEVLDNDGKFIGFDVVIGNPPYFSLEKSEIDYSNPYLKYNVIEKRSDIYTLFYELGLNLLGSKCYLNYITSSTWMRSNYGATLRNYLLENFSPELLIDFSDYPVFETATVLTNIILVKNIKSYSVTLSCLIEDDFTEEIAEYFNFNSYPIVFNKNEPWSITSKLKFELRKKVSNKAKPLVELGYKIYNGFRTGFNEAYLLDKTTVNKLIKDDENSKKLIKKIIRGRDIEKNAINYNNEYVLIVGHNKHEEMGV
jgi:adenine-specific DNA-methyltransferase